MEKCEINVFMAKKDTVSVNCVIITVIQINKRDSAFFLDLKNKNII